MSERGEGLHAVRAAVEDKLTTRWLGRRLIVRGRCASTMLEAREAARAGEGPGLVVVAGEQSAGRGRLERPFVSPRGGLYLSALLAAPPSPADAWRLGFATAVAARRALVAAGGPREIVFDWPNDLLFRARKIGGILAELLMNPPKDEDAAEPLVVVGLGLNVGPDPRLVDSRRAGSSAGRVPLPQEEPLPALIAAFLEALEELSPLCETREGWADILGEVRSFAALGSAETARVRRHDGTVVEGKRVAIDEDGSLVLRRTDGGAERVRYGEVVRD